MKTYKYILLLPAFIALTTVCSKNELSESERIEVTNLELGGRNEITSAVTRAPYQDYIVNTVNDPTNSTTNEPNVRGGNGWKLDLQILKGASSYVDGDAIFSYSSSSWSPDRNIFFPNYTRQNIQATLYQ